MDFLKCALGIEFGSTRIKAVLIDQNNKVLAKGSSNWENRLENGIWTYSNTDIINGMQECYASLKADVKAKYGVTLKKVGSMGISAMMHGYLVLDKDGNLLVPFRTWRNNNAANAADELTKLFGYHIPARWSIAHLYNAILNREEHLSKIDCQTTLEGYIHYLLTGEKIIGIGEASGMFPIDIKTKQYNAQMVEKFQKIVSQNNLPWKLSDIMPKIALAGQNAGYLTQSGAMLLDPDGDLESGIMLCPPEGDAQTGMIATNTIEVGTGNVSAGTSIFELIVLEKEPSEIYPEVDLVTTPSGDLVANIHCNNCTSEINNWVNLFAEYNGQMGFDIDKSRIFEVLFNASLKGDTDCGGVVAYPYVSGEHITEIETGVPMLSHSENSNFSLSNVMRAQLYSSIATLKIGLENFVTKENIKVNKVKAHGGLFINEGVCQNYLAAALNAPVSVAKTAGEGGPFGMAVLANYLLQGKTDLVKYLNQEVFCDETEITVLPDQNLKCGFDRYIKRFKDGLSVEKTAGKVWNENA